MTRLPAEWEPQAFIQFTFPHRNSDWAYMYAEVVDCFVTIIETTAQYEPVLVGCDDPDEVRLYFKAETKYPIQFISVASNDTWARDHGAITILKDNHPILLDFEFNGWGKKFDAKLDNLITTSLVQQQALNDEHVTVDFVLEGGGIESDGEGTLLTTSECLLSKMRNPDYTKSEIEDFLNEKFGIQRVLWLDHGYLAGDDTDSHIDTLARFCDANTIAYVKCDDPTDEHFDALSKMEEQLQSFEKANGDPYTLIPLPWPDACFDEEGQRLPATYANFLILNGAVMVPIYGVEKDDQALKVLKTCFPKHEVVGVDCRPLIEQHGSLHCITMQYPQEVKLAIS